MGKPSNNVAFSEGTIPAGTTGYAPDVCESGSVNKVICLPSSPAHSGCPNSPIVVECLSGLPCI